MNTNIHPAPGLGAIMPGAFVVPQNPLQAANVGAVEGTVVRGVTIGEIVRGRYPVPQNPLAGRLAGINGINGDCGCGCKGAGGPGSCQDPSRGLGDFSLPQLPDLSQPIAGFPLTYWIVGGLVTYFVLSRGSDYRDEARELRAKYKYEAAKLKRSSPRRYARVQRTLGEGLERFA